MKQQGVTIDPRETVILVVDDNSQNLKLISALLKANKYKFSLVNSGKKALEIVEGLMPDIILLDIMMPEMDGFEVCEKLKKNEKTSDIPVIFITAKASTSDIVKGLRAGGVDYITKPFNNEELLQRVLNHLMLKESRNVINRQNKELKEINDAKDKFFSILAHDLKNPFSGMIGSLRLLDKRYDKLTDDIRKTNIGMVLEMLKCTYTFLENLLVWSRIQTGKIKPQTDTLLVKSIVEAVQTSLQLNLEQKQIQLSIDVDEYTAVKGDYFMVSTVVRNLITNAIKFTPNEGRITVWAQQLKASTIVAVEDTGTGMDEELASGIFLIDKKTQRPGTNGESGTGLGLMICKEFIEANGGKIGVKSKPGEGSTFSFTLPTAAEIAREDEVLLDENAQTFINRFFIDGEQVEVPSREFLSEMYDLALAGELGAVDTLVQQLLQHETDDKRFVEILYTLVNEGELRKAVLFLKPFVANQARSK